MIQVANAPCSWGVLEFAEAAGETIGYAQMLDELVATGYAGTELGDWGYLPTEPETLRAELTRRGLALLGAYVPVAFRDPAAHAAGAAAAVRTARLIAAATEGTSRRPFIVLADANGTEPMRIANAGRITPAMMLHATEWPIFTRGVEHAARAVRAATGLACVFHPHCAGWIETPEEIARLLDGTDPALVSLCFDTAHFMYGGGDPGAGVARFGDRIAYAHCKDCDPAVAAWARAEGHDYFAAVRAGVFCELGRGAVDFPAVLAALQARGYDDWIVVEQDVLPGMGTPRESAARNRAYLQEIGL